ncbi:Aste57867_15632 [Aphanomyces stellatus]|uniref:peptide-methionine (S)-S-oxide reductase n=1 Tax=Aphanomyces stellatus TaxID=120398 RepID=A0A485L4K1_9STRA|nr:hypothetical protein As57867_015576 [Aphanomyces stellatus]VFT92429.1 Aste57867_15632 [Aphanomyces stellatus]
MLGRIRRSGAASSFPRLLGLSCVAFHQSVAMSTSAKPKEDVATFAAGCFWGVELHFQRVPGVLKTRVGYTNGRTVNPTYEDICTGETGHAEAIEVTFDKSVVSFRDLVDKFWSIHDPTTLNRQKNDIGTQYRSGIYYHSEEQKAEAEASKDRYQDDLTARTMIFCKSDIVTEILPAGVFYEAEGYHQRYLEKGGQCARKGATEPIRCYG